MKIQCACGAKYNLDIQPGTAPIQFVCARCGADYSNYLNELARSQSPQPASPPAPSPQETVPPPSAPPATPPSLVPPPPATSAPRLRISSSAPHVAPPAPAPVPAPVSPPPPQ